MYPLLGILRRIHKITDVYNNHDRLNVKPSLDSIIITPVDWSSDISDQLCRFALFQPHERPTNFVEVKTERVDSVEGRESAVASQIPGRSPRYLDTAECSFVPLISGVMVLNVVASSPI